MTTIVLLDSGPLGAACSPRHEPQFAAWMGHGFDRGVDFVVSEVGDFEVRRELLRVGFELSILRLDRFLGRARVVPVTTDIWLTAARLDVDVLLAATAISLQPEGDVVIATTNVGHLAQFVDARLGSEVTFP